jgi:hypothetical protein
MNQLEGRLRAVLVDNSAHCTRRRVFHFTDYRVVAWN